MAGIKTQIVGEITQSKIRGKAMSDELAKRLTSENKELPKTQKLKK